MKSHLLALSSAALLFTGSVSAAAAAPSESLQYANRVQPRAESLLLAARIDPQGPPVSVRARVGADGHLTGLEVLRSSGSRDTDRAVKTVLRKVVTGDPPIGLLNGAVTLNVGQGARLEAQAR